MGIFEKIFSSGEKRETPGFVKEWADKLLKDGAPLALFLAVSTLTACASKEGVVVSKDGFLLVDENQTPDTPKSRREKRIEEITQILTSGGKLSAEQTVILDENLEYMDRDPEERENLERSNMAENLKRNE